MTKPFDRQWLLGTLSRSCNVSEEGLALVAEDDAPSRELELRQHPHWRSTPVIAITAKDLREEDRMDLNGSLFLSGSVKQVLEHSTRCDRDSIQINSAKVHPNSSNN